MALRGGNPRITIKADASDVERETGRAARDLRGLERTAGRVGRGMKVGIGIGAAAVGSAGLAAAGALKKSADAAVEAEKSQARLKAQLDALGFAYDQYAGKIDSVIQKQSALSGLDDEDLQDSFTNIVRVTGDVNKALELNALAADIARARQMDVAQAGELVGKVAGGNTGILSRYGIVVEKGASAQEALATLQEKFAGQAEEYGKTTAGALDRASVATEGLGEMIGAKVAPLIAKGATAFVDIVEKAGKLEPQFKRVIGVIGGFVDQARDLFDRFIGLFRGGDDGAARWADNIKRVVDAVIGFLKDLWQRGQRIFGDVGEDLKIIGRAYLDFQGAVGRVMSHIAEKLLPRIGEALDGVLRVVRGFVKIVAGLLSGDFKRAWEGVKTVVRGVFDALKGIIRGAWDVLGPAMVSLGKMLVRKTGEGLKALPGALKDALVAAVKWAKDNVPRLVAGALKSLGKAIWGGIKAGFGALFGGDGLGKAIGDGLGAGQLPALGGGLMGARPSMAPFAALASRFGVRVSSGRRPGAMTSTGRRSYHSTGEAIDLAGSPAGMLATFRALKAAYGSRLAELIYTPGGVGILNGRPHRYTGQVAAEHHDHVHVALDTGAPGVGDGYGDLRRLWIRAGGNPAAADIAAAIALAESSGDPRAFNRNTDGSVDRGLWQINSVHGELSTFDRMANARAAVRISRNGRDWTPWTVYRTGAYKRFLRQGGSSNRASGAGSTFRPGSGVAGSFRGNIATGVGSTTARGGSGGGGPDLVGPREGAGTIEGLELARAEAGDDPQKLLPILIAEIRVKARRLNKVKAALRKRLRKETRSRLTQEATQLIGEINDLWEAAVAVGAKGTLRNYIGDFKHLRGIQFTGTTGTAGGGAAGDAAGDAGGGGIQFTGTTGTAGGGAAGDAAGDAGGGGGAALSAREADPRTGWIDQEMLQANAALALAGLTPDTADDLAALQRLHALAGGELELAKQSGDPAWIIEAANQFKSITDAIHALTEQINEANELQRQRDEIDRQILDNQDRLLKLAGQGDAILAAVIAAINGAIGGSVGLGFQAAGTPGAVARY